MNDDEFFAGWVYVGLFAPIAIFATLAAYAFVVHTASRLGDSDDDDDDPPLGI